MAPPAPRDRLWTASRIRGRGWPPTLMQTLLGDEDLRQPHPHHRAGPPMRLYLATRVEAGERDPRWIAHQQRRHAMAARARAQPDQRRERLFREVERLRIRIPPLASDRLLRAAIGHYNRRALERDEEPSAAEDADPVFLERITVHYLRHRCTCYDRACARMAGRTGVHLARLQLKQRILDAIAAIHPWLADACARQRMDADDDDERDCLGLADAE